MTYGNERSKSPTRSHSRQRPFSRGYAALCAILFDHENVLNAFAAPENFGSLRPNADKVLNALLRQLREREVVLMCIQYDFTLAHRRCHGEEAGALKRCLRAEFANSETGSRIGRHRMTMRELR